MRGWHGVRNPRQFPTLHFSRGTARMPEVPISVYQVARIGINLLSSITDAFTGKPFQGRVRMGIHIRNKVPSWTLTPSIMTRPQCTDTLQLVLDLAQEALDTVTLLLLISIRLVMLITHESSHRSGQRTHTITHPRTFRRKDDSLHPSLSVVPTIIRTIGGVVAGRTINKHPWCVFLDSILTLRRRRGRYA